MTNILRYATGQCDLGPFVIAMSEHGLAMVEPGTLTASDVAARFPEAEIIEDPLALRATIATIAARIEDPQAPCDLALDLRGSELGSKGGRR
jgi:AraC family transcriptional regulator of adaptative response/methylated-DNA-[protein]-cysteine methyltransferase